MKNTKQEFQLLGENFRFVYEVSGCDGVEYTTIFWVMTCSLVAMYLHFALPAAYIFRPEEKSELRNYAYFSFYFLFILFFLLIPFFLLLHNSSPFHPLTKEPLLGPQAVVHF